MWVVLLPLLGCKPDDASKEEGRATGMVHRLTPTQLDWALLDLAPGLADGVVEPVREPVPAGFVDDLTRPATPYLVEELVRWVDEAAPVVATAFPGQMSACDPDVPACGRRIAGSLLERAWRRPVTEDERAWIGDVFEAFQAQQSFSKALTNTSALVLSSPEFLHLVMEGQGTAQGTQVRLADHAIGNRLSFLLWDAPPDELVHDALAYGLQQPDQVRALAETMLDDPRRTQGLDRFFVQWLDVEWGLNESAWDLPTFGPLLNPSLAEEYAEAVAEGNDAAIVADEVSWRAEQRDFKADLRQEVEMIVARLMREGASLRTLLTTPWAYVGPASQHIYDVVDPTTRPTGRWVTLDEEQWPGLLTRGAVLAARGHPTEPSPVLRGAFLAERLMCLPPPSPPAGIPSLQAATEDEEWTTNRERYEVAVAPSACAGCHAQFNGYGYALESFSAIGAPRALIDGQQADTRADLPGLGVVSGPAEMMEALASSRQVHDCFVSQFFQFATYGLATTPRDDEVLGELQDAFWASGGDLRQLVLSFVGSDAFLVPSVPEASP